MLLLFEHVQRRRGSRHSQACRERRNAPPDSRHGASALPAAWLRGNHRPRYRERRRTLTGRGVLLLPQQGGHRRGLLRLRAAGTPQPFPRGVCPDKRFTSTAARRAPHQDRHHGARSTHCCVRCFAMAAIPPTRCPGLVRQPASSAGSALPCSRRPSPGNAYPTMCARPRPRCCGPSTWASCCSFCTTTPPTSSERES